MSETNASDSYVETTDLEDLASKMESTKQSIRSFVDDTLPEVKERTERATDNTDNSISSYVKNIARGMAGGRSRDEYKERVTIGEELQSRLDYLKTQCDTKELSRVTLHNLQTEEKSVREAVKLFLAPKKLL